MQNLDTDNVASKRRNPIIADLFSRMHFMERRGSGFKKIKADYHRAINYRSETKPVFKSTPTSFFVTLYNLNYNIPIGKTGLEDKRQAFDATIAGLDFSMPTKQNILKIYRHFGFDIIFARADVMKVTGITATPATALMKKLREAELIEPVRNHGRGKYKFTEPLK